MIDPVAFTIPALSLGDIQIGPFPIYWYAFAYLGGFLFGGAYAGRLVKNREIRPNKTDIDEFLLWAVLGVILGGRLGYVLFYNPALFINAPQEVLMTWKGGMSFHGGLLGVIGAIFAFSYVSKINPLRLGDVLALVAPIGLFFGRIANFVNGELWGRATNMPWGMVFENSPDGALRHPSQFYEAGLEGVLLFIIMGLLWHKTNLKERAGALSGIFLMGYGLSRIFVEFFREPDLQLGFIIGDMTTMGQVLSLPMLIIGGWLYWRSRNVDEKK